MSRGVIKLALLQSSQTMNRLVLELMLRSTRINRILISAFIRRNCLCDMGLKCSQDRISNRGAAAKPLQVFFQDNFPKLMRCPGLLSAYSCQCK